MQLFCSTGAFTRNPDRTDHRLIIEYGSHFAVDGFEVIFYPSWYSCYNQILHDLQQSGLSFPAVHTEKKIGIAFGSADPDEQEQGIRWFTINCSFAQQIGAKTIILHLWEWPQSDDYLERNLQPLKRCLDIADKHNVLLAVETVPCKKYTPLANLSRVIAQDPRCYIALDTEFLANHSQLFEVFHMDRVWEHQRIRHIHIKDFDGQAFFPDGTRKYLHPGEGNIDFSSFFEKLEQHEFSGALSLEASALDREGNIDETKIEKSLQFIQSLITQY